MAIVARKIESRIIVRQGIVSRNSIRIEGGLTPPVPPIKITSYRLAYKTEQEHSFDYVEGNNFVTVFDGAVMYITPPPGIVLPMTVVSSDPTIAEVGAGAIITWHKAETVMLTATDQYGNEAIATFSPSLFFVASGEANTFSSGSAWAQANGLRLATKSELTSGESVRAIGSLFGEWGATLSETNATSNNPYTFSTTTSSNGHWAVRMLNGASANAYDTVPDGNTLGVLLT